MLRSRGRKSLATSDFAGAYLARQGIYTLSPETALLLRNKSTAKGVIYYGSFQSGTEQGLHRNEQPPPTQQGAFLKGKRAVVANAVTPRRLGLHLERLILINREKIDAIREAIKELERAGYIVRSRERDEKGRLRGADYVIFEQPQPPTPDLPTLENPTLDNPTQEKPTLEKPTLENPTQLNKDIQRTDLPKKKNQIQIYQVPIPFLSFPLTPLLAEKRLRRRNGKERKRQHRAQLIYTGKSSRTISTTTFSNRT